MNKPPVPVTKQLHYIKMVSYQRISWHYYLTVIVEAERKAAKAMVFGVYESIYNALGERR